MTDYEPRTLHAARLYASGRAFAANAAKLPDPDDYRGDLRTWVATLGAVAEPEPGARRGILVEAAWQAFLATLADAPAATVDYWEQRVADALGVDALRPLVKAATAPQVTR